MKTTEKKGELWCRRRHDVVHTHGPTNIYTRNVPTVFWVTVLKNTSRHKSVIYLLQVQVLLFEQKEFFFVRVHDNLHT
jgi:hypothetical protein